MFKILCTVGCVCGSADLFCESLSRFFAVALPAFSGRYSALGAYCAAGYGYCGNGPCCFGDAKAHGTAFPVDGRDGAAIWHP